MQILRSNYGNNHLMIIFEQGGCITDVTANNLILALEPEAASLCCRRPAIAGYRSEDGITFPPDTVYLLLDCGGEWYADVLAQMHPLSVSPYVSEFLFSSNRSLFLLSNILFDFFSYSHINFLLCNI